MLPQPSSRNRFKAGLNTQATSSGSTAIKHDPVDSALRFTDGPDPESEHQAAEACLCCKARPMASSGAKLDDYGTELSPNARIWPIYVAKANEWDKDLVDGWHRSALFVVFIL
ncbi:hypothetical protein RhiJN_21737 [Ceratobasidium sp. AG-Ba]|nr:hypothetical protein RhiJN_21737 [Ceratobasidium sp. AG-Ba]